MFNSKCIRDPLKISSERYYLLGELKQDYECWEEEDGLREKVVKLGYYPSGYGGLV